MISTGATADMLNQLLSKTFAELGATGPMIRTLLFKDRYFAGQKLRCGQFQVVLLAGDDEITFYEDAGIPVKTVRIDALEQQKAA